MALVAAGLLYALMREPEATVAAGRVASESQPRRPSPETLSRWLRASNDKLAARAAAYALDAPRRRNDLGPRTIFVRSRMP